MAKRTRIFTDRKWDSTESIETIEVDEEAGQFFWRLVEDDYYAGYHTEACFPVDMQFVSERFAGGGRIFDRTKFPQCAYSRIANT